MKHATQTPPEIRGEAKQPISEFQFLRSELMVMPNMRRCLNSIGLAPFVKMRHPSENQVTRPLQTLPEIRGLAKMIISGFQHPQIRAEGYVL